MGPRGLGEVMRLRQRKNVRDVISQYGSKGLWGLGEVMLLNNEQVV